MANLGRFFVVYGSRPCLYYHLKVTSLGRSSLHIFRDGIKLLSNKVKGFQA